MTTYNDQVSLYISSLFAIEDEHLLHAKEDASKHGLSGGNIKPEEGRFLNFLVKSIGATKALEIGTLSGYSGIWIARGLKPGGKLITIEKEANHAEVAQLNFNAAGLEMMVNIRVGEAINLLKQVQEEGPFDFIFVDADRPNYPDFFDWSLENLQVGGIFAAHNAFRKGSVAGIGKDDEYTELMRKFNKLVASKPNWTSTIFPAGDGTLIAGKYS